MSKAIGFGILGVLGVVCIIGGSVFLGLFPGIIKNKIKEELPLKEGSDTYERWRKLPVPITMKFHIFHLENHDNYTFPSNIKLVEKGPYVFDEERVKENITYLKNDKGESLVRFRERKVYTLNKDSVGKLNETVTFINLPVLGIALNRYQTEQLGLLKLVIPSLPANEKTMFIERTAGDLLFNGFKVALFDMIKPFIKKGDGIELGPFSISDGGSNKSEESWTIHTGIDSMDKYGQIYKFDDRSTLTNDNLNHTLIWKHDDEAKSCNELKGTDGTMFSPSVSKDDVLYAFEPQLCRSVFFRFGEETSVRGIDTYRFWVPEDYFQSPNKNIKNTCYCPEQNTTECKTDGLLEISNCLRMSKGAPIVMSAPYFLHGDPDLRNVIHLDPKGKKVVNENYGTFLDIEPMTGTVLRATRRIQINIEVGQYDAIPHLKGVKKGQKIVVPALWLEESAEADEKQADEFKSMVLNKKKLGNGISIAVIVIGALMTITAIVLYIRHKKRVNGPKDGGGGVEPYRR